MKRKDAIRLMATSMLLPSLSATALPGRKMAGKIKQSVCQWCFNEIPLRDLAIAAKEIGIQSVELLHAEQWPVVLKEGLTCAMAYGESLGLSRGFNNPELHAELLKQYSVSIPKAENDGLKQIICFPGNRNGISDEAGMENCAVGLDPVVKLAEKHNIIISMELMNSKLNHPDYQADSTEWAVKLVDKIGSPNFKLLYDIYHMQVQEGNVIATIQKYSDYISHYHTAGVPGRHEIGDDQELFYPAIMNAIAETGFQGYVGQEFLAASSDKLASLKQSYEICNV